MAAEKKRRANAILAAVDKKLRGDTPSRRPAGASRRPAAVDPGDAALPLVNAPTPEFVPGDAYEGPLPLPPQPDRFRFWDAGEFFAADFRPEWLVPGVLVKGQPGTVAGPSKGMKTSILVDLAVSLTAGAPFLGEFPVRTRRRVALVSGESGQHVIKETAARVCKARGVDPASLAGWLFPCFDLPTFTSPPAMVEFADRLASLSAEVVLIDPLYLCLGGGVDAANLFQMGEALRPVSERLHKAGITTVLAHHANKLLKTGEPMELDHLSYSGLQQFVRQFILINRRTPYQSDGNHELYVRAGGSAGHGGLWEVDIAEGLTDHSFGGRWWEVTVRTASEGRAERATDREEKKRQKTRDAIAAEQADVLKAIDAEVVAGNPGATRNKIRERTGMSGAKVNETTAALIEDGAIESVEFNATIGSNAKRAVTGYRRFRLNEDTIRTNRTPDGLFTES